MAAWTFVAYASSSSALRGMSAWQKSDGLQQVITCPSAFSKAVIALISPASRIRQGNV
jgi:hypothetical protein